MASVTNGQSSGRGAHSEKRRPDAPASPEKKPKAPSSHKKKPDASDRSAVRNEGTLSEPNLKAPSPSKPKKVSAGKRAKDEDAAKEQPEPKKISASKGNKPVQEETMAFITNGQNSGRDADSEKGRPDAAASPKKKPKAPSSHKKKPEGSDRSAAVRNEGIPLEPNLKAPSASKPEKVAAGKRAKDDEAAKEQPEPKKISVSKGNKPVQEEAAPSKPSKKKPRKQQQESTAVVAVANHSGNDSLQKSSKKTEDNHDAVIKHGCLDSTRENPVVDEAGVQVRENPVVDEAGVQVRENPVVDEAGVQVMERKWREFEIFKLEVSLQRIALLREECSMVIEALKKKSGNARTQ